MSAPGDSAQGPGPPRSARGIDAFRHRAFAAYWLCRMLAAFAVEMQMTTVGWQVYRLTGNALDLGLVGLAQFAPFVALFLVTGLIADRFSRVRLLALCTAIQVVCAAALFVMSYTGTAAFGSIMAVLVLLGVARAFQAPVLSSMLPNLVPKEVFANALAWTSSGYQIAKIAAPTVAGLLIAFGDRIGVNEVLVYGGVTGLLVVSLALTALIHMRGQIISRDPIQISTIVAGLRFIWTRQVIFAAIGLDLFAVLFGGATALLPIYAKDILQVGSEGFGILRAAFTVGAFIGALWLTQRPVRSAAGIKLMASVAVFGLGVIVFGLSHNFWLSFATLAVMGLADVISVFIRHNLVQLVTPDEMRGRVGAVVGVFVGASNELGEFESGVTAAWWGVVPAVVVGGVATVAVAATFAALFPALRRINSLDADLLMRDFRDPHDRHGRPRNQTPP